MVYMITGKQNSGKSAYYEKKLVSPKIYFATLRDAPDRAEIIARHKARRGGDWIEGYSAGDIDRDMALLAQLLDGAGARNDCFIDGLVNWSLHCFHWSDKTCREVAGELSARLRDLINGRPDTTWYLLDNLKSDYEEYDCRAFGVGNLAAVWETLQSGLRDGIKDMEYLPWNGGV